MWVDIGVNITAKAFAGDRDAVMARACAAGVSCQIFTGTSLSDSAEAQQLAEHYRQYCTAGVHPHQASEWHHDSAAALRALATQTRVCAIGECGLDFNRNFSPAPAQERAFSEQLALAADMQLPVFLHCRDAHARFLALLKPWLPRLPAAVLHCFTGSRAELADCLALGLYIGITGWICDERRGQDLLQMLSDIPHDRLLLETDAPWLLPRDLRPKPKNGRNEPALLPHIANAVAERLSLPLTDLAALTRNNAVRVFGLADLADKPVAQ